MIILLTCDPMCKELEDQDKVESLVGVHPHHDVNRRAVGCAMP